MPSENDTSISNISPTGPHSKTRGAGGLIAYIIPAYILVVNRTTTVVNADALAFLIDISAFLCYIKRAVGATVCGVPMF